MINVEPRLTKDAIKQAKFFELGLNFANIVYSDEPNKIATEQIFSSNMLNLNTARSKGWKSRITFNWHAIQAKPDGTFYEFV